MQILTLSHLKSAYSCSTEISKSVAHGRIVLNQPLASANSPAKLSVSGSWLGFARGEVGYMDLLISGGLPQISIPVRGLTEGNFSAAMRFSPSSARGAEESQLQMNFTGMNTGNFRLLSYLFAAKAAVRIERSPKKAAPEMATSAEFKADLSGAITHVDEKGVSFITSFNVLSAPAGTGAFALAAAFNGNSEWQNQSLLEWLGPGEYSFAGRLWGGLPKSGQPTVKAILMAKPNPRGNALAETTVTFPLVSS